MPSASGSAGQLSSEELDELIACADQLLNRLRRLHPPSDPAALEAAFSEPARPIAKRRRAPSVGEVETLVTRAWWLLQDLKVRSEAPARKSRRSPRARGPDLKAE